MVAHQAGTKAEDILPRAMSAIFPSVRLAAGLPPLVTPTSQIVGAQAVNCALDEKSRASDVHQQEPVRSSAWSRASTDTRP